MNLIKRIFIWWSGATLGTLWQTMRHGRYVGADSLGNRYYQDRTGKRRWVIYKHTVDASLIPPDWHGWLHHTFREPPTVASPKIKPWEQEHRPNLTGTPLAYRPRGSLAGSGVRQPSTSDYEAWEPK
ncbi:MAG: NADH:ubiquinone oxidoreductase subunit NDUFA12 [Alphaproteobacteria bacterium]|nr:NADH:ubiquinone oxidoreductase subunit NDUFA12 [Alphaproteobacteria bacterium]